MNVLDFRTLLNSEDIDWLVDQLPEPVVKAEEISGTKGQASQRTFRLTFDSGRSVKIRRLPSDSEVARVAALLPCLPAFHFPQIYFGRGPIIVEPWIEGTALMIDGLTDSILDHCGQILAQVHLSKLPKSPSYYSRSLWWWRHRFQFELEQLLHLRMLTTNEVNQLQKTVYEIKPITERLCLAHRDFCHHNLVIDADSSNIVSIDNMSIEIGQPCEDLARTFYRWPMSENQRQNFLLGYSRYGDLTAWKKEFSFWISLVMVHATCYQLQMQAPSQIETLSRFKLWISGDSNALLPTIFGG